MALSEARFDHLRLARDAEMAGQAFGFEDVEAGEAAHSAASAWLACATCLTVVAAAMAYAWL